MKKKTRVELISLVLLPVVVLGSLPSLGAVCRTPGNVTIPGQECGCENAADPDAEQSWWSEIVDWLTIEGECTGPQYDSMTYSAPSGSHISAIGEAGYCTLVYGTQRVGTAYPCLPEENVLNGLVCEGAVVGCAVVCIGSGGWACLCIPGVIEVCQWCTITDCEPDTNDPHTIVGNVLFQTITPCVGK